MSPSKQCGLKKSSCMPINIEPDWIRVRAPGSDDAHSLQRQQEFKKRYPGIPTKSGIMLGLSETNLEIEHTLRNLRAHHADKQAAGEEVT